MASASSRTPKCGNVPVHAVPKYKKSSGRHCVVFGCQNNQRKRSRLLSAVCEEHNTRRESCRCGVFSLHRFPSATKNAKLRHQWIAALNRKNYQPSENARVSMRAVYILVPRSTLRPTNVICVTRRFAPSTSWTTSLQSRIPCRCFALAITKRQAFSCFHSCRAPDG